MGLLTADQSNDSNIFKNLILKRYVSLSVFSYAAAIAVCILLLTEQYVGSTYFSDNALLPGLANREFNAAEYAKEFYKRLNEAEEKGPTYQLIYEELQRIGLKAYTHEYILQSPFGARNVSTRSGFQMVFKFLY